MPTPPAVPRPCFEIKVASVRSTGTATYCRARLSVVQDVPQVLPTDPPWVRTAYGFKDIVCDAGWDYPRLQQTLRDLAPVWANEIGAPVNTLPVLCELIATT